MLLAVGAGSLGFVQVDLWSLSSTLYNFICCTYVVSVRCDIESFETSQVLSWLFRYKSRVSLSEKLLMSVYVDSDNGALSAPQRPCDFLPTWKLGGWPIYAEIVVCVRNTGPCVAQRACSINTQRHRPRTTQGKAICRCDHFGVIDTIQKMSDLVVSSRPTNFINRKSIRTSFP